MERNTQQKMSGASSSINNENRGETSLSGSKLLFNASNGNGVRI